MVVCLEATLLKSCKDNQDVNYVIIDDRNEGQRTWHLLFMPDSKLVTLLVSLLRKLQKLNKLGFVGGMESEVITRFRAGFEAGVKSVDPSIKVQVDYLVHSVTLLR